LHKSDLIWELHFQTCQNYVNIGDEIFVKIIDKRNDEFYIASMLASHPDYDPLLEPNLRCGAIWQSKVVYFKKKGKFIQYYVDIFPCCWGQFYEKTNRHILVNDIVNVRILDTKNIKSYSNYGYYCKADLQIVYDCNNIVNCYHPEIVPSIKINRLR
jgi:ribosomal protein S1